MVKLRAALPKTPELNGLVRVHQQFCSETDTPVLAIVALQTYALMSNVDTGDVEPYVKINLIEPVPDELLGTARAVLQKAHEMRLGTTPLPGFEDAGVDWGTGEVKDTKELQAGG